jgi:hypothetical protein
MQCKHAGFGKQNLYQKLTNQLVIGNDQNKSMAVVPYHKPSENEFHKSLSRYMADNGILPAIESAA